MDRVLIIYNKFKREVIDTMQPNDIITREQIKYKMRLTDFMVDKLLFYIKRKLCTNGFNSNVMCSNEGFRVEFTKTKKGRSKMYFVKI